MSTLLEVNNLKTYFFRKKEPIPAVDGVDFHISKGETVALVGESGSEKALLLYQLWALSKAQAEKSWTALLNLKTKTSPHLLKTIIAKSAETKYP